MDLKNTIMYSLLFLLTCRALHHLLLWMEKRGWVYYQKKPQGSGLGNALQELNSLINPSVREVLERKYEDQKEDKQSEF